jgi:hypothetical protein
MNNFEHMVIVESPDIFSHLTKRIWCQTSGIGEDYYVMTTSSTDAWFFKNEEDATVFKLKFGSGE